MDTKNLLSGLIGFFIGGLLVSTAAVTFDKPTPTSENRASSSSHARGHDSAALENLKSLAGDAFDEAYINMMSEHHAGAIAMTKPLVDGDVHDEVKTLAKNIISAQTKEIADMKQWARDWGYSYQAPSQTAIDKMTSGLQGKQGAELEKQFLFDMMEHHKGALDMAQLAAERAKHQEIIALSKNIDVSQTAEMATMMQLIRNFNYMPDHHESRAGHGH